MLDDIGSLSSQTPGASKTSWSSALDPDVLLYLKHYDEVSLACRNRTINSLLIHSC